MGKNYVVNLTGGVGPVDTGIPILSTLLPPTPATLQGNIFIDPQNTTGAASHQGPGTAAAPFLNWSDLVAVWGTIAPYFTQATTITFLSSHTDNTDPVVWCPYSNGVVVKLLGTLVPVAGGAAISLTAVTAKSNAAGANSLLLGTLTAAAAAGQLVQDTTQANSIAWTYKSLGANAFSFTQPFAPNPVVLNPAENNSWTTNDTVSLFAPTAVNLAYFAPVTEEGGLSGTNTFVIQNLTVFDPGGAAGTSFCYINALAGIVIFSQCAFNRSVLDYSGSNNQLQYINCIWNALHQEVGGVSIIGGAQVASVLSVCSLQSSILDGDFILGGVGTGALQGAAATIMGFVYLDKALSVFNGIIQHQNTFYGGHVLYGSATGQINLKGASRFAELGGQSFTAGLTAPLFISTGMQMNGASSGHSVTVGSPDVLNGGITTAVAHLDAAAGAAGFGSNAFDLGGASISNAA